MSVNEPNAAVSNSNSLLRPITPPPSLQQPAQQPNIGGVVEQGNPETVTPEPVVSQNQTYAVPQVDNDTLTPETMERAGRLLSVINRGYSERMVGQEELKNSLIVSLLAGGHILLESVPGLAKTTAAHSLASTVQGTFKRIQCTPDLLPSDIVGTQIWNQTDNEFETRLGPVHANFVLLDEINRSSAKTQSAMLESMQERQTSIGGKEYPLPKPFFVMATQNPIEQEGTYHLPEAQLDRFIMKDVLDYPSAADEYEILERMDAGKLDLSRKVESIALEDLVFLQQAAKQVYVDTTIRQYIINLIWATRNPVNNLPAEQAKVLEYGGSPRATIAFVGAARANALLQGRDHVIPEDVQTLKYKILRHRLILSYEADIEGIKVEDIIDSLFNVVPIP